jgi:Caspase domain
MSNRTGPTVGRDRGFAALSKPELARFLLESTAAIVCGVLALWLLFWVLFHVPGSVATAIVRPSGPASPVIGFQEDDALRLGRGLSTMGSPEVAYTNLEASLNGLLVEKGQSPVVLYLSAPGAAAGKGAFLLPADDGAFLRADADSASFLSADTLLERFLASPSTKKLLILDAGQVGTDRDMAIFANAFMARLRTELASKKPKGLAVLSATAPGQVSWVSEPDQCSVFGHYVAQGLAGRAAGWDPSGQVTVRGLAAYVRHHVERWTKQHRQAVQTPILIGDEDLNFPLKRASANRAGVRDAVDPTLLNRLNAEWVERDRLESLVPYRYTPLAWKRYVDGLHRAQRFARVGRNEDVKAALDGLAPLRQSIEARANGWPIDRAWSLALGRVSSDPAQRKTIEAASNAIDEARDQLTGATRRDAARKKAESQAKASPPPTTQATPKDAPAKGQPAKTDEPPAPKQAGLAISDEAPTAESALPKLDDMLEPSYETVPKYVEAQLLVWGVAFAKQSVGNELQGDRGEVLRRAMTARRLAEAAVSVDDRAIGWIEPLVREGDLARRRGQDLLFSHALNALEDARTQLREATRRYERAVQVAKSVAEAHDLADRMAIELPYLGAWNARRGKGIESAFESLLTEATALRDALDARPSNAPSAQWEEAWKRLDDRLGQARSRFADLVSEFRSSVDQARSGGQSRWRDIDDLLVVPTLPADARAALLSRLDELSRASRLSETTDEPSAVALMNRSTPSRSSESKSEDVNPSPPDPASQRQAVGEARLELGLLELGGADKADLELLKLAVEACKTASSDAKESSLDPFVQFGDLVRAARSRLLERTRGQASRAATSSTDSFVSPELDAADRAARILPSSSLRTFSEENGPDRQYARFVRHAQLLWLGRRLSDDFAPEHAQLVLAAARSLLDSEAVKKAIDVARNRAGARLVLRSSADAALELKDKDLPLSLRASSEGDLPPGDAVLLLGLDPSKPLTLRDRDRTSSLPIPAPLTEELSRRLTMVRTDFSSREDSISFSPSLFYRGRVFGVERAISVSLVKIDEPVTVTIQDRDARGFPDQFNEHPGQGYLHHGTTLRYKLVLRNNLEKPLRAFVSFGLDGQKPQTRLVSLKPGQRDESISDAVRAAADLPDGKSRTLVVSIRDGGETGPALAVDRNFPFRLLQPEQYMTASAHFDSTQGLIYITAVHLRGDLVTGPVTALATVEGQMQSSRALARGEGWIFWFPAAFPFPPAIPWSLQAGLKPNAFSGKAPTGTAAAAPTEGQAPKL